MQDKRCTSCDTEREDGDLLESSLSFNINNKSFVLKIYFCRQCADYALETFADQIQGQAPLAATAPPTSPENKDKTDPLGEWNCSFCNLAAEQCKIMLQFCQFFFTPHNQRIHVVKHDRLFLSTHQDQNPQLVGRGLICDRCVGGVEFLV